MQRGLTDTELADIRADDGAFGRELTLKRDGKPIIQRRALLAEVDRLRARVRELEAGQAQLTSNFDYSVGLTLERAEAAEEELAKQRTLHIQRRERAEKAEARVVRLEKMGFRALGLFESDRPYAAFAAELRAALEKP